METARSIAARLLSSSLAACVSVLPAVTSMFEWQDTMQEAAEHLLFIKTSTRHVQAVFQMIGEIHPYECPELVSLPIESASDKYSAWIQQMTS